MTVKFINTLQALAYYVLTTNTYHNRSNDYATIILWISKFITEFEKRLSSSGKK